MTVPSPPIAPGPRSAGRRMLVLPFSQEEWRRRTEWPLAGAAVVFLAAYAWSVLGDLSGAAAEVAEGVMGSIWLVFVVDYAVTLLAAEHRRRWFVTHLPQFLVVVLPMFRPLRLLRLITLWGRLQTAAGGWVRGRVTTYVVGSGAMLVGMAALAELEAERHAPGAVITDPGRALWWAATTITTVGYGDLVPVTAEGRVIAVGLMIAGIALLGVVTATLASWLVERVRTSEQEESAVTTAHIDDLSRQVHLVSAQLHALQVQLGELHRRDGTTPPLGAAARGRHVLHPWTDGGDPQPDPRSFVGVSASSDQPIASPTIVSTPTGG